MIGIVIFVAISLVISVVLTSVAHFINNVGNSKVDKIKNMLPGYNCGACGFSGCEEMAEKLVEDSKLLSKCKPIKKEDAIKLKEYLKKVRK